MVPSPRVDGHGGLALVLPTRSCLARLWQNEYVLEDRRKAREEREAERDGSHVVGTSYESVVRHPGRRSLPPDEALAPVARATLMELVR